MKTKSLIIVLLVSIWITNCSQPPKDATNDIIAANAIFAKHFNDHNGEAIGKLYTKNGRLMPVNSPVIEGQEAIGKFWSSVFDMGIDNVILKTKHVESFENTAIEEGAYTLFDANKNKLDEGKYVLIWKKEDNQWRLDRDIFSTNLPPAEAKKEASSVEEDTDNDQA